MDGLLVVQFQQAGMTSEEDAEIMLELTDRQSIFFQDYFIIQVLCCQRTMGHMTHISSFALITSFFLRGANERNSR